MPCLLACHACLEPAQQTLLSRPNEWSLFYKKAPFASRAIHHAQQIATKSKLGSCHTVGLKIHNCCYHNAAHARLQEAEVADMLKARIDSGKAASTSQTDTKPGVEDDSIFADLDTEGMPSCSAFRHVMIIIVIVKTITITAVKILILIITISTLSSSR